MSMPKRESVQIVTGRARYGADISANHMLYCKVKHSERPHAKILSIDTSEAEKLEGVAAFCTADDLVCNDHGPTVQDEPFMAKDYVYSYYDSVIAVAAETKEIAEKAVDLIRVEYEDLPGVFDPFEAMKADSPKLHGDTNIAAEVDIISGDVDTAFAKCAHIYEQKMYTPINEHAFIEPHAAIAYLDNDELVVRTSVQRPALIGADLGIAIGWPQNRIHMVTEAVGGGFGGKNEITFEHIIAVLAIKTKRPVKMVYTREEEFDCSTTRHRYWVTIKSGVDEEGHLLAREVQIVSDSGPYVGLGKQTLEKGCIHGCGPYVIPNTRIHGVLVYTNNSFGGAMRGFGVTQLGFVYELHTDYIAREMNMHPVEFRKINLIQDNDRLPTGMIMQRVNIRETMERAIELARQGGDWE